MSLLTALNLKFGFSDGVLFKDAAFQVEENDRIGLIGANGSGKTTLFNSLTGSNQYVGNWPGVTVEKKEGQLKQHPDVIITDLPGIYSLSPYTLEEVVARDYLLEVNKKENDAQKVFMEPDVCWLTRAGIDPAAFIGKYAKKDLEKISKSFCCFNLCFTKHINCSKPV